MLTDDVTFLSFVNHFETKVLFLMYFGSQIINEYYDDTNSELVTAELMKSYCMPFILYATEALPLSNRIISMLDNCVSTATAKFFSVTHRDNIMSVRQLVNLPRLTEIIEKRKQKLWTDCCN